MTNADVETLMFLHTENIYTLSTQVAYLSEMIVALKPESSIEIMVPTEPMVITEVFKYMKDLSDIRDRPTELYTDRKFRDVMDAYLRFTRDPIKYEFYHWLYISPLTADEFRICQLFNNEITLDVLTSADNLDLLNYPLVLYNYLPICAWRELLAGTIISDSLDGFKYLEQKYSTDSTYPNTTTIIQTIMYYGAKKIIQYVLESSKISSIPRTLIVYNTFFQLTVGNESTRNNYIHDTGIMLYSIYYDKYANFQNVAECVLCLYNNGYNNGYNNSYIQSETVVSTKMSVKTFILYCGIVSYNLTQKQGYILYHTLLPILSEITPNQQIQIKKIIDYESV